MVPLRRKILLALAVLFALVLVFSALQLMRMHGEYQSGQTRYSDLAASVREPQPSAAAAPSAAAQPPASAGTAPGEPPAEDDTLWPAVDFEKLAAINDDVIGWIYIEGTNINYPVVKTDDNEYYLDHLFDGTRNKAGCIFLDMASSPDLSDGNSILHGHHMKDGSMFAHLVRYKDREFYEAHPTALLLTPDARYRVHLFSGYVTDASSDAWRGDLAGAEREAWLCAVTSRSLFTAPAGPGEADRILTLSTCTYEYEDARFVVHGYLEAVPY